MGGIMRHLGYTPSPSETSSNAVTQTKDSILLKYKQTNKQTNKHTHTLTERNLNWEEEEEEEVSGRRSSYS